MPKPQHPKRGGKLSMIVYYKLAQILKDRGMCWKDLSGSGISPNIPQKFSQNRNVNTDTIDKVCAFLDVQPGDIMEYAKDEKDIKRREIKIQMEALQRQMEELQKQLEN